MCMDVLIYFKCIHVKNSNLPCMVMAKCASLLAIRMHPLTSMNVINRIMLRNCHTHMPIGAEIRRAYMSHLPKNVTYPLHSCASVNKVATHEHHEV